MLRLRRIGLVRSCVRRTDVDCLSGEARDERSMVFIVALGGAGDRCYYSCSCSCCVKSCLL